MEYEVIRQLKQSKKSTVSLVQEKGGGRMFVRKVLAGRHPVYQMLQKDSHPCLAWRLYEIDDARRYYATWDNLDDYEDDDFFNVTFYDQAGDYLMNNTWSKREIVERGYGGIPIRAEFLPRESGGACRFTVQVYSSRPNQYASSPMPDPAPEEYYSPWLQIRAEE